MSYLLLYGFMSLLLVLLLSSISLGISENLMLNREEVSAYECGFEHVSYSRLPFSFRYFFLTLIFLVFDMEVVFLLFLPSSFMSGLMSVPIIISSLMFIIILLGSLVYEWIDGSLEWLM